MTDGNELGFTAATRLILWTQDFDETLAFYRDKLGLSLAYPSGGGWAEFRTGGDVALCLHADRQSDATTEKVAVFGWRVEDLDTAVAALRARGVQVGDPQVVTEGLRAAEFEDPSRNSLFVEGP